LRQAIPTKTRKPLANKMQHRLREGLFILAVAVALFLLVALVSYHPTDPGWLSTGYKHKVLNGGGKVGAWLADVLLSLFGMVSYLLVPLIIFLSWVRLHPQPTETPVKKSHDWIIKTVGVIFFIISSCGLVSLGLKSFIHSSNYLGGILGEIVSHGLRNFLSSAGSTLLLATMWLCGVTVITGLSWLAVIESIGESIYNFFAKLRANRKQRALQVFSQPNKPLEPDTTPKEPVLGKLVDKLKRPKIIAPPIIVEEKKPPAPKISVRPPPKNLAGVIDKNFSLAHGTLPPLTLLNPPSPLQEKPFSQTSFEELSQLVEQRLSDFGVQAKVVAVYPGPVITRFELELAPGIKVSKITSLSKDIARSLSTVSVRVVEVIPGKSVIGLEIPNENRELVTLREILESQRFTQSRSPVSLALGKDISGNSIVVDLFKMPHLLVAGTTGSGKSVSLNAMLLSMLFKSTPEQLRLILIDPKMLELSVYEGIPHLLTPVIIDMKDAANALRWCVAEMDKRYRLMASLGVRNLAGYNQKVGDAIKQGQPLPVPPPLMDSVPAEHLQPLPMIVVIADELADMMMVVGKKVEDLIARIAQKARAAGIHLILATQRPSVDVITGLIKANIPTRMAFQVSSRIDSRTILDQQGAEQLLGHGDMLYLPPGAGIPMRIHGAYVADEEVHRVVAAWRTYGQPEYLNEVTQDVTGEAGVDGQASGEQDPLYDQAVQIVTESRRASISLVQRRLRIGYNRAARMMEDMEAAGVVSAMDNSGTREVLAPPSVG